MNTAMKIIKQKEFEANGIKHTYYTVAYKGRYFGISTLYFESDDLVAKDGVLNIKTSVEAKKKILTDAMGETKEFIELLPKLDIGLALI
jgi:predicted RNA-binding protein